MMFDQTLLTDRYDFATEVLSSAIRILRAAGFDEKEIPLLFEQVATKPPRAPLWLQRPAAAQPGTIARD
jgi:hypothetical protein